MIHLNGNLLCAVDIETCGLDYKRHDIYEIAIVPLDSQLKPNPNYRPLDMLIKPDREDEIDWDGMSKVGNREIVIQACKQGTDKFTAADYLVSWFEKLKLPEGKKVVPLAQNWAGIDKIFILDWLGQLSFDTVFHHYYRDTMTVALYLNDRADVFNEKIPFPKCNLQYLCSQLNIERKGHTHRAINDAVTTAEVYAALLRHQMSTI